MGAVAAAVVGGIAALLAGGASAAGAGISAKNAREKEDELARKGEARYQRESALEQRNVGRAQGLAGLNALADARTGAVQQQRRGRFSNDFLRAIRSGKTENPNNVPMRQQAPQPMAQPMQQPRPQPMQQQPKMGVM